MREPNFALQRRIAYARSALSSFEWPGPLRCTGLRMRPEPRVARKGQEERAGRGDESRHIAGCLWPATAFPLYLWRSAGVIRCAVDTVHRARDERRHDTRHHQRRLTFTPLQPMIDRRLTELTLPFTARTAKAKNTILLRGCTPGSLREAGVVSAIRISAIRAIQLRTSVALVRRSAALVARVLRGRTGHVGSCAAPGRTVRGVGGGV